MSLSDEHIDDVLWAARAGDLDALKETVAAIGGTDTNATIKAVLACKNESGHTPLHFAAANNHQEIVSYLLSAAGVADVLAQNESGNTALHWAAFNGHVDVAAALVDRTEALENEEADVAKKMRAEEDQREHERHMAANKDVKEAESDRQAELAHHDELQRERALWDVRNKAGRGPMSEAQMADREAVVQMLLGRLAQHDKSEQASSATPTPVPNDASVEAKTASMTLNDA